MEAIKAVVIQYTSATKIWRPNALGAPKAPWALRRPHSTCMRCGGANDGRTPNLGCTQEQRRKPLLHRRSCMRWRE